MSLDRTFDPLKESQGDAELRKSSHSGKSFCWSCCKDKGRLGGKFFGVPKVKGGFMKGGRFKCADCLAKSDSSPLSPTATR